MPRRARIAPGGLIYHVLNRGVGRMTLFRGQRDYVAFLKAFRDTLDALPIRVLSYCLMPNHWHLVLWPERDGQLAAFMQKLTITHARRWLEHRHAVGSGHVYQGRYKSFVCKNDEHLQIVCRYVERNALRAKLVRSAEAWPWSSLPAVLAPPSDVMIPLTPLPCGRRRDWAAWVNKPRTKAEEDAVRASITTSRPFGDDAWQKRMCSRLGLPLEQRPRGRPKKVVD
jgi:putative transposase